jgi:ATP-dependent RNA helicase DDX41
MSVKELAKGTVYTQALETGWKPPAHIRALSEDECEEVRTAFALLARLRSPLPAGQATHTQSC